ncbi:MAG: anhydro-N-acetylmuramic acid kinase [Longimicrobiales bacterium]|nr:anhydro-N-acetylmuramic acid kinase [Longimicrobiales bacterium]
MKVVGLMSGTSLDGVDAVVMEILDAGPSRAPDWRVEAFESVPYTSARRRAIEEVLAGGSAASVAALHAALGEWLAEAAMAVCEAAGIEPSDVDVLGSHGQTLWHAPPGDGIGARDGGAPDAIGPPGRGWTLQLGDPATIAERTGIPVVSDFRARDMAAGGQGAPLVPWVDRLLFAADRPRALVNIGGMANVTRVPRRESAAEVIAFDTGPGNAVIDAAMALATDGERVYDANGEWALRGRVDDALAAELLADPWLRSPPPKSTGRERFGRPYVEALAGRLEPDDRGAWAALVATLTAVVARSIARGVREWADPGEDGEVIVTGGGAENPVLLEWLTAELEPRPVLRGDVLAVDPAAKEAVAFAVLAWAHVTGRPGSLPSATGAAAPRVLGSLTPGRDGRVPDGYSGRTAGGEDGQGRSMGGPERVGTAP